MGWVRVVSISISLIPKSPAQVPKSVLYKYRHEIGIVLALVTFIIIIVSLLRKMEPTIPFIYPPPDPTGYGTYLDRPAPEPRRARARVHEEHEPAPAP